MLGSVKTNNKKIDFKMKIGILTLIGEYNYGNLLQSYALQVILQRLGYESITLNRRSKSPTIKLRIIRIISFVKSLILRYVFRNKGRLIVNPFVENYSPKTFSDKTELKRFIKEYIKRTKPLRSEDAMRIYAENNHFDAIIVGSDQVWREECVYSIEEMFLSFLPNNGCEKKVAYAASFGTDKDYITQEKIPVCVDLIKRFDAISVREKSAVKICDERFEVKAEHVLDPTMLLSSEDYKNLFNKRSIPPSDGNLLMYILDNSNEIKNTINVLSAQYNLTPFSVNLTKLYNNKSYNYIYPSIESWLKGFNDAKYVITDSFHGTVFSIIFNKPFICLGNEGRGSARFDSLLGLFGLENRLIDDYSKIEEVINTPIDWKLVNSILEEKRKNSLSFIENALNN